MPNPTKAHVFMLRSRFWSTSTLTRCDMQAMIHTLLVVSQLASVASYIFDIILDMWSNPIRTTRFTLIGGHLSSAHRPAVFTSITSETS